MVLLALRLGVGCLSGRRLTSNPTAKRRRMGAVVKSSCMWRMTVLILTFFSPLSLALSPRYTVLPSPFNIFTATEEFKTIKPSIYSHSRIEL